MHRPRQFIPSRSHQRKCQSRRWIYYFFFNFSDEARRAGLEFSQINARDNEGSWRAF
ncbi:MAG: Beta-galactosidase C-terminal domain [Microbacteriaceae bacterium]|nr:Beta-galactosidase C-terminal domain [Microbacteriaceae bacterium]